MILPRNETALYAAHVAGALFFAAAALWIAIGAA